MLMDSPREVRCTDTNPASPHRAMSTSARMRSEFTRRQPRTTFAAYRWPRGRWIWAKLMNYDVIVITEADFSDDPAFIYPFRANKVEDFEVAVREAIAEW